jgi:hypothetical protein
MASYDRSFHQLESVYDLASRDITAIKDRLSFKWAGITEAIRESENKLQKDREAVRLAREQLTMR